MSLFDWLPWARARRSEELADELRAHLEMAEADRIARGEPREEAAANARREFGNVGLVQEIARDEWGRGAMWLERLGQDVRFALRTLRRAPGFATAACLTIAVGIGATTAIFSVVNATLVHPLPYPHAEQLVRIEDDLVGVGARDIGMSTPEWHDLQRSGVFEYVSPTWFDDNNLTGLSHAQRVGLLSVAPNYFTLLGSTQRMRHPASMRKSSSAMACGEAPSGAIRTFSVGSSNWTRIRTGSSASCRVGSRHRPRRRRSATPRFGRRSDMRALHCRQRLSSGEAACFRVRSHD
jgi:hypothetical protein